MTSRRATGVQFLFNVVLVLIIIGTMILVSADTTSARDSVPGVSSEATDMAVRSAGPFNIAVVQVWHSENWANDDFGQLDAAPGTYSYTWAFLPYTSLTSSGLSPYNVLIIPDSHDYSWLDATGKAAIVAWVNSGKLLIVHCFGNATALTDDPLMAAFGANYRVDWTGEMGNFNADYLAIVDAASPLLTTPNTLTAADLGNWMTTIHNSINPATSGSAWHWTMDSVQTNNHWWGYAASGSGSIVISGGDPELHAPGYVFPADKSIPRKLIENEIVFTAAPPVTQYSLTVNITGQGTVTRNPDQATYTAETPVQLTANPASGWNFSGWSGGLTGSTSPATITMDGNKIVTATFSQSQPTPVPGVSDYGLYIMAGLFIVAAFLGLRRMRQKAN